VKGLASLGAAGLIAAAGALWLLSNPVVVKARIEPVRPSAELPTFKHVPTPLDGNPMGPEGRR